MFLGSAALREDDAALKIGAYDFDPHPGEAMMSAERLLACQRFACLHAASNLRASHRFRTSGSERLLGCCRRTVELLFEHRVCTSKSRHNHTCPINVIEPSLDGPIRRRACGDRTQIADLIGEFDHLCLLRLLRRVLNLSAFPDLLVERFVVRKLLNEPGYLIAES